MELTWRLYGIPEPQAEFRFHPTRKWRFDYAWPTAKYLGRPVAVEIEGGIWTRGRHTTGRGYLADLEKYNEAARLGWFVLRFTPTQLRKGEAQTYMKQILEP